VTRTFEAHNRIKWTPETLALLGHRTDDEVAEITGLSLGTVFRERIRRGIVAFKARRPRVAWTAAMIALLGTDTDASVAAALDVSPGAVNRKRRMLAITAFAPRAGEPPGITWTRQIVDRLGTVPDGEIAAELHVSTTTVQFKRQMLGIAPFVEAPDRVLWTDSMLAALGTAPDREVAGRLGISITTVKHKRRELGIAASKPWAGRSETVRPARGNDTMILCGPDLALLWTPEIVARLGRECDTQIARDIRVSPGSVRRKRRALGIGLAAGRRPWTEAELGLLGTAPDEVVAERINRSLRAVGDRRRACGVAEFDDR